MIKRKKALATISAIAVGLLVVTGCSSPESMDGGGEATGTAAITVGSTDYYSNEIIAEIYAQVLEAEGFDIKRDFRIGPREIYIPEVEDGSVDLIPDYSGNLLQFYDKDTTARASEQVYSELQAALPKGVVALDQAEATDQDSYNVTAEFAAQHSLKSLVDLRNVTTPITLGGNSELETRPYGPDGLASVYGVDVKFTPIEDSGGPLTLKALLDGDVQLVNIYSADPAISENNLVTLADPDGLFLSSHVVPLASDSLPAGAVKVINGITAKLTPQALVALNVQSVTAQRSAADIAKEWLATL